MVCAMRKARVLSILFVVVLLVVAVLAEAQQPAEEVRVHHQSESGEANRPNDSAERVGAGG